MKKVLAALLAAMMIASLSGCMRQEDFDNQYPYSNPQVAEEAVR